VSLCLNYLTPKRKEDRKDDEEFMRQTLPVYRASLGWQTEEASRPLRLI
jgi:hypothetical protein